MTTLIPTSQHQQTAAATAATATPAGVESYEDMFKEITRKLYGDESAHGLYPINNAQVAQLAQTPSAPPEGERSFTTLVSDRSLAQLEYENVMPAEIASGNFKSEEHLSTAFGLAALMHNGFPPPTINFPVTSASNSKQTTQSSEDRQWNQQQQNHHHQNQSQQQEESGISWNSNNKTSNTYTQKLFKIKTKQEPVAQEIIVNTGSTANGTNIKTENTQVQKRYNCSVCPYSTDRRDLFTRHENIHKEEKPFHCYACLKQFNRADHVKKHFVRMHREMEYDINKTRRYPPSSKQANSINSNNNSSSKNNNYFYNQQQQQPQQSQQSTESQQLLVGTTINIPTFSQNPSTNATSQQQQQQQQQHATAIIEHVVQTGASNQTNISSSHQVSTVNIKHEKTSHPKIQKAKGEKRFMCCYCPWSGADNWGLKRHLNTHTKPFVCLLCDYKAARSERLTTHIFKVHNKKACNKCNFFADDQAQLTQHQLDSHQLQMQAIGRNTASVAQDFRSAGGENFITNAIQQQHNKGNIITLTSLNRDATESNGAIGLQQRKKPKAMSPIDHSPPAETLKAIGLNSDGLKRRRKMSPTKDKENVNELLTKQLTFLKHQQMIFLKTLNETAMSESERTKAVNEINEIFEKMYSHSLSVISSIESENKPKMQQQSEKFNLPDFLTNNKEITVIMEPKLRERDQSEIRKNRKQLKPKKIEKPLMSADATLQSKSEGSRNVISDLRDKHMVCLVTRKKYCFTCRNKSMDSNTFYSKTSLLLHKLWRHSAKTRNFECHHCQAKFSKIYKLKLHKKLKKH